MADKEKVKTTEVVLSYPPKDRATAQLVKNWKMERRVKCCHKDCPYPLNIDRKAQAAGQVIETEDGPAYPAVCSWDPRHKRPDGSAQYILVSALKPPEDDEN